VLVVVFPAGAAIPGSVGGLLPKRSRFTHWRHVSLFHPQHLTFTSRGCQHGLLGHGWKEPELAEPAAAALPNAGLVPLRHWYARPWTQLRRRAGAVGLLGGLGAERAGPWLAATAFIPQEDDKPGARASFVLPGGASLRSTERVVEKVGSVVARKLV